MGYNSMIKHQHYAEAVRPISRDLGATEINRKLTDEDMMMLSSLNYRSPKTIYCNHPEMVDSRNLYYKTEWVSEYKYLSLKNRWGKSCKLLKKKGNK